MRSDIVDAVRRLPAASGDLDLGRSARATAYGLVSAVAPCALFLLALSSVVGLDGVWRDGVAPSLREAISYPAYLTINTTVLDVLTSKSLFWVTGGLALAVWQLSGAVRSAMRTGNDVYEVAERRSRIRRLLVSVLVAAAVGACVLVAIGSILLVPLVTDGLSGVLAVLVWIVRWIVAVGALLLAIAVVMRMGPHHDRPLRLVSVGAIATVVAWILMSLGFGIYVRGIAVYGSVFGNLVSVVILVTYLYASSLVLVHGMLLDRLLQGDSDEEDR